MPNMLFPDSDPAAIPGGQTPASAPTGIAPLNTSSYRDLLPPQPQGTGTPSPGTAAPATTSAMPASGVQTAPVVAAPVLGSVGTSSTVAGQIRSLLSDGNPYVESARQRALQMAGSRGLQNSSIALQSGEEAAIAGALPIAQQDASTNFNQGLSNQNAQNSFGLNEQQIQGQSRLQAEGSVQRMSEAALAGDIQSRQILEQAGYNFQLSAQDNVNRLQQLAAQGDVNARLALQQFGFQTQLLSQEGSQSQQNIRTQGEVNAGLASQQFGFQSQLLSQETAARIAQINAQGDQSARLAQVDFDYRSILLDRESGIQLRLEDQRFQQQQALLISEYGQRTGLTQEESRLAVERINLQHTQTLEQIRAQADAQRDADYGPRLQAQYLASVSDRMNNSSQEISQIYSTQGLTAAQQQVAVNNAYTRLNQDLGALQAYYQQSPLWDPAWGQTASQSPTTPVAPPGFSGTPPSGPPTMTPAPTPESQFPDTPYWNNRFPNLVF